MTADPPREPGERRPQASASHPTAAEPRSSEIVELSRQDCLQLLASQSFGRLAVNLGEGAPIIRPVNYQFDTSMQSVVFRTAQGSKFHALLREARAAFEVDGIESASRTGWSVIIIGVTEEVTRPLDIRRLEGLGLEPWAPGPKPHWMHIRAWVVSGRRIVLPTHTIPGKYLG